MSWLVVPFKEYSRPCLPLLWPRLYAEPFGLGEKKQVAFRPSGALSGSASRLFGQNNGKNNIENALIIHKSLLDFAQKTHLYGYLVLILTDSAGPKGPLGLGQKRQNPRGNSGINGVFCPKSKVIWYYSTAGPLTHRFLSLAAPLRQTIKGE